MEKEFFKWIVDSLRKKWLSTLVFKKFKQFSKKQIEEKIKVLYQLSGLKEPSQFIWCKSPVEYIFYVMETAIDKEDLSRRKREKIMSLKEKEIFNRLEDNFINKKYFNLFLERLNFNRKKLSEVIRGWSVKREIFYLLESSSIQEFGEEIKSILGEWGWLLALNSEIRRIFDLDNRENLMRPYFYSLDILGCLPNKSAIILLDYLVTEGHITNREFKKAYCLIDIFQDGIWFAPFESICFIIDKPTKIKLIQDETDYLIFNIDEINPFVMNSNLWSKIIKHTYFPYEILIDLPHSDKGPAIVFKDGFSIWAINGVIIPPGFEKISIKIKTEFGRYDKENYSIKIYQSMESFDREKLYSRELVEKLWMYGRYSIYRELWERLINFYIQDAPGEIFPVYLIFEEENAHIRSNLVRKIGMNRITEEIKPEMLDSWGNYELLKICYKKESIEWTGVFLKMKNPSTGEYHIEGVPPDIKTCKEALSWRIGGLEWNPVEIT